jgi:HK97 family phage portal protein
LAGFLDALRAFFSPPPGVPMDRFGVVVFEGQDSRALNDAKWGITDTSATANSSAGEQVTIETALTSIAVQAAIRLLTNDIASLPVDALQRTTSGKQEIPKPAWMVTPAPLNPNVTWDDHVKQVVFSLLTDGNAFIYALPNVMRAQELRALDPATVEIISTGTDTEYRVQGASSVLTPFEIIHVPWVLRPGKARGLNPIEAAAQGLGIALAADSFVGDYFGNGAVPSSWIEVPPGVELTEQQITDIKDSVKREHVGKRKHHAAGMLTGGAKLVPFDYSNRDAQLLELRDHIVEEVARLFGIPPHMLGSQKPGAVGYASVEQRSIDYVQHALLPIINRIEKGYGRLLPSTETYIKFNLNGVLRGDSAARAAFYREMLQNRVMPLEEVRALEDLNPNPEAVGFLRTPNNSGADPRYEAVGALIRAGFDPAAALAAVGLPPITHIGLPPVTVQPADTGSAGAASEE